jgi:hypothetical protein
VGNCYCLLELGAEWLQNIKEFLLNNKEKNSAVDKIIYNKQDTIILLTSSHDTNNNFISLVNQEVFGNEAIVLSFNKSRGEANFHDIKSYKSIFKKDKIKVFFVDDSISSVNTVKYFYQLLNSIESDLRFDSIIVMIDRTSSYDEMILSNYVRDNHIYAFATFHIKPIKTDIEECFLCKRKEQYINLAKKSALDLTTFQMARRAHKLKKVNYKEMRSTKDRKLVKGFKTYLKAMAVNHISANYLYEGSKEFENFKNLLEEFLKQITLNLPNEREEFKNIRSDEDLQKILKFQSEIALIKALSFPKLSYFYKIRKFVTDTVLGKLKIEANKSIQRFKLEYILDKQDEDDIKKLTEFIKYYKEKTNLHLINTYFATLGYFHDSKILDTDYIRLYLKIIKNQEVIKINKQEILHIYPFAVKFTIAEDFEKAQYFKNNINEVANKDYRYKWNENIKLYALLNALKLENSLYIKQKYFNTTVEKNPGKIVNLKNILESDIIKIFKKSLFVSPYITSNVETYKDYIDKSQDNLVNIFDNYKSIQNYPNNLTEITKMIFYGAIDISDNENGNIKLQKVSTEKIYKKIDNTWANYYNQSYIAIRLTSVNEKQLLSNNEEDIKKNNPIWFKPIGCIVLEKKEDVSFKEYFDTSMFLLSIKDEIVDILVREFNTNFILEATNKNIIEKELRKRYRDMITTINHSIHEYIDIGSMIEEFLEGNHIVGEYEKYLNNLKYYSRGLKLLTKLYKLKDIKKERTCIIDIFKDAFGDTQYKKDIKTFINICGNFSNKLCNKCNGESFKIKEQEKCHLDIDEESFKIILFELVFNALRRMNTEITAKITLQLYKNHLIISNTLSNPDKHIENFNNVNLKGENSRMGIGSIKEAIKSCGYKIFAKYNKNNKEINIELRKMEKNYGRKQ